jgi:protein-S-isoprenylcysteine O-methyltransferase Ste14
MRLVDKLVEVSSKPSSRKNRLIAKVLPIFVFFFFFPMLFFIIPNFVLDQWFRLPTFFTTATRLLFGGTLLILGAWFLLWTVKAQREIGKGTPMPLIATKKLVIEKPYSFTRNPLAFGLINFYYGISIVIGSISSLVVVSLFSITILAYIKFIEEKELAKRYGDDYLAYKEITPFLLPRRNKK